MSDLTKVKDVPSAVTTAIEAIQGFAKYLLIPTGVVTFLPDKWLDYVKLLQVKNSSWGMWISILFWISFSIVAIDLLQKVIGMAKKFFYDKKVKKNFSIIMDGLTDTEKQIIFLISKNDMYNFDFKGNAALTKLKNFGVIYSNSLADVISGFSYGLQPIAQQYLIEHPEFFDSYVEKQRKEITEELEQLREQRKSPSPFGMDYELDNKIQKLEHCLSEYE